MKSGDEAFRILERENTQFETTLKKVLDRIGWDEYSDAATICRAYLSDAEIRLKDLNTNGGLIAEDQRRVELTLRAHRERMERLLSELPPF